MLIKHQFTNELFLDRLFERFKLDKLNDMNNQSLLNNMMNNNNSNPSNLF